MHNKISNFEQSLHRCYESSWKRSHCIHSKQCLCRQNIWFRYKSLL